MNETIPVKASLRAIRLWLAKIADDEDNSPHDRWMAKETLDQINK